MKTKYPSNHLSQFNQQVLRCQDDAYTLAWYLLGDEAQAASATQASVAAAFPFYSPYLKNCRVLILKQVINQCRAWKTARETRAIASVHPGFPALPELERYALILIDILNLSYTDTAVVLDRSVSEISGLLSQGRRKLTVPLEQFPENTLKVLSA